MKKLQTLKPIHPNASLIALYQKRLKTLVKEMHDSVIYHLVAEFKRDEEKLAQDAAPVAAFTALFKAMGEMWMKKFSFLADSLSKGMAEKTLSMYDKNLQRQLKEKAFSVEFKMTRNMENTMKAIVQDQVNLITNLPEKYLREIDGLVIRAVSSGRSVFDLSNDLQKQYRMTKRRADLIAVDQCNKAHAMIQRQRQKDAGITKAIWMHSGAGRHPRPDHVAANGREYDVDKGCLISGEMIFPGEMINCRCLCRAVISYD